MFFTFSRAHNCVEMWKDAKVFYFSFFSVLFLFFYVFVLFSWMLVHCKHLLLIQIYWNETMVRRWVLEQIPKKATLFNTINVLHEQILDNKELSCFAIVSLLFPRTIDVCTCPNASSRFTLTLFFERFFCTTFSLDKLKSMISFQFSLISANFNVFNDKWLMVKCWRDDLFGWRCIQKCHIMTEKNTIYLNSFGF